MNLIEFHARLKTENAIMYRFLRAKETLKKPDRRKDKEAAVKRKMLRGKK